VKELAFSRLYRPEKKPLATLDQEKIGICVCRYHCLAALQSSPVMLMHPGHGSLICTARLKWGLLAANGTSPWLRA